MLYNIYHTILEMLRPIIRAHTENPGIALNEICFNIFLLYDLPFEAAVVNVEPPNSIAGIVGLPRVWRLSTPKEMGYNALCALSLPVEISFRSSVDGLCYHPSR